MSGSPVQESVSAREPAPTAPLSSWSRRLRGAGGAVASAAVLVGGTAAGQLITLIATPILTRLYDPAAFGLLALVVGFLNVAAVCVTLRFELPILSAPNGRVADRLVAISLGVAVPASIVAAVVLHFLIRFDLLSYGALPAWIAPVAALALVAAAAFTVARAWAIREHRVGEVAGLLIGQGVGRGFVPVIWGWLIGGGLTGLVVGEIAGRVIGSARLLRAMWPRVRQWLRARRAGHVLAEGRRHWQMPVIAMPSSLIDVLALSLPAILLADRFGAEAAGLFMLVQRLIFLPTSLVGASAADVFQVRIARIMQSEPASVRGVMLKLVVRLVAGAAACMLPVALFAPRVTPLILGSAWAEAGVLMVILIPWSVAAIGVSPVSRLLVVVGRNQWKLIYDVLSIVAVVAPMIAAATFNLGFQQTVLMLSLAKTAAYVVYLALIVAAAPPSTPRAPVTAS